SSSVFCQVNYVRNADFETYSRCPEIQDQISLATGWFGVDTLNQRISCIPDYIHSCNNAGINKVIRAPASSLFWQYPHSGDGIVQMVMYQDGSDPSYITHRDYLQNRLTKRLVAGNRYCVRFYVCLEESSTYAVNEISASL